jgi:hypothetical protein
VTFLWVLFDSAGGEAGRSEEFADREAAEAWLSERWRDLRESGVEEVALRGDGGERYRMSLGEDGV